MPTSSLKELVSICQELASQHPTKYVTDEYPGVDYLIGLYDEAIWRYSTIYLNHKDEVKATARLAIDAFSTLKRQRYQQIHPEVFDLEVMRALW